MRTRIDTFTPSAIKFFAVTTALPRWVLALLAADGLNLPPEWGWVHWVSGLFGVGMCVLEGVALAYILGAMAKGDRRDWPLIGLVVAMIASFVGVLTPSIYARATGESVANVLSSSMLWLWSFSVGATTFSTVMATGYAQAKLEGATLQASVRNLVEQARQQIASEWQQEVDRLRQVADRAQSELARVASECNQVDDERNRTAAWATELQDQLSRLRQENEELHQALTTDATDGNQTVDRLLELYAVDGQLSHQVAATILGISRQAVGAHLKRLEQSGLIEQRNGNGVVVLSRE